MVHEKFGENPINGLYGIADGHAGFQAAQFCHLNLLKKVQQFVTVTETAENDEDGSWTALQEALTRQFGQGKCIF